MREHQYVPRDRIVEIYISGPLIITFDFERAERALGEKIVGHTNTAPQAGREHRL
jgi:hypothetical protein